MKVNRVLTAKGGKFTLTGIITPVLAGTSSLANETAGYSVISSAVKIAVSCSSFNSKAPSFPKLLLIYKWTESLSPGLFLESTV